jgi:hypothetical protein
VRGRTRIVGTVAVLTLAAAAAGCGAPDPLTAPTRADDPLPKVLAGQHDDRAPAGSLTVGIPAEPTAWIVPAGDDLAALDLAALWGLPLYRMDAAGHPVRALAAAERLGEDGREVEVELRPGEWSDGTPVRARDVVATVEALRGTALGPDLDLVEEVTAVDDRTVRFRLREPTVRWPLLPGAVGILPAHVLEAGGVEAAAALEVTGGVFRLGERVAGLGATFVAHPASPLGPPVVEELHVRVVPMYDVALGLLDDGELDAAIGHLAIGAVARANALGLEAAGPVGGTWVSMRWTDPAAVALEHRRGVAAVVDVTEQVEGLRLGELLTVPVLGSAAEVVTGADDADDAERAGEVSATLVVRTDEEALSVTGRLVEAQLRAREARLQLRRERTPADVTVAREADLVLEVRRDHRRVDLGLAVDDEGLVTAAAGAPTTADAAVVAALEAALAEAVVVPLYRPAVAHVWRPDVAGIVPSAWPGAGFASAAGWHRGGG